jgi:hypothetical protein
MKQCADCTRLFDARRIDARFCSDRCRQRASRARRALRLHAAEELIAEQRRALANGADPIEIASLARAAQQLLTSLT